MSDVDKRNRLSEEPFTYRITKNGTVVIYYKGKQIKFLKDREALRLIERINEVENNITELQLLLAKITGNFKRGNEKCTLHKVTSILIYILKLFLLTFHFIS
ncbi:hypothetical protein ACIP97_08490 [Peribacillus frigoritolerans]|uniref:hypothetical protein n=1 Tax=Peribacillus frigoritolerans TaxID=450367 RepID=UPI00382B133A